MVPKKKQEEEKGKIAFQVTVEKKTRKKRLIQEPVKVSAYETVLHKSCASILFLFISWYFPAAYSFEFLFASFTLSVRFIYVYDEPIEFSYLFWATRAFIGEVFFWKKCWVVDRFCDSDIILHLDKPWNDYHFLVFFFFFRCLMTKPVMSNLQRAVAFFLLSFFTSVSIVRFTRKIFFWIYYCFNDSFLHFHFFLCESTFYAS